MPNLEPGASRVGSGGQRVVVGQPRSSVVESTPGVARRNPNDSNARDAADPGRRNPAAGTPSSDVQRDPAVGRRAVPRESSPYDLLIPSQRTYGSPTQRGVPATPRAEDSAAAPGYRDYSRRAPDRPEPGVSPRPEYRPYGTAIPRAPESTRPSAPEARPYGGASPNSPESARPAAPESRPYGGIERRAPVNDRPSGPPPESARPAAPERSNPGADRNAPAPDNRSAPNQGRARPGGQPSSGGAVRRGGGR